ncbi:MAG: shikimate dehydrogenase [Spirochaetes bacterium GWB1_36_13]|nr:MAG: shikimate dehydrogenase [Spirochaetes bacterium GWB1_36_13]
MPISGTTSVYCIFGNPVKHSFSPLIHNASFQELGINGAYVPFEVTDIETAVKSVKALGIKGVSVTIPFKISVMPFLDELTPLAKNIEAVNTLFWKDGKLMGHNTDGLGALKALKEKTEIKGKKILILGCGGASRAIAMTLSSEKPQVIGVTEIDEAKGKIFAKEIQEKTGTEARYLSSVKGFDYDILINTTPLGMHPHEDKMPLKESEILENRIVFDIVYNPKETLLLKKARGKNCEIIYGYKMLLYQGMEQFKIWTSQDAPESLMEKILTDLLPKG